MFHKCYKISFKRTIDFTYIPVTEALLGYSVLELVVYLKKSSLILPSSVNWYTSFPKNMKKMSQWLYFVPF